MVVARKCRSWSLLVQPVFPPRLHTANADAQLDFVGCRVTNEQRHLASLSVEAVCSQQLTIQGPSPGVIVRDPLVGEELHLAQIPAQFSEPVSEWRFGRVEPRRHMQPAMGESPIWHRCGDLYTVLVCPVGAGGPVEDLPIVQLKRIRDLVTGPVSDRQPRRLVTESGHAAMISGAFSCGPPRLTTTTEGAAICASALPAWAEASDGRVALTEPRTRQVRPHPECSTLNVSIKPGKADQFRTAMHCRS
jgi:hypothetical protein